MNEVLYGENALDGIFEGADSVVKAVVSTIGSKGRNVILADFGGTYDVTNDGVTVARKIYLSDVIQNTGAGFIRMAASATEEDAGDGTTTTTAILGSLLQSGKKALQMGIHPRLIKRTLDVISEDAIEIVDGMSMEIGDDVKSLSNVATISANNDQELGQLIGKGYHSLGKNAKLNVRENDRIKGVEFRVLEGMTIDRGAENRAFMPPGTVHKTEIKSVHVLITDFDLRAGVHGHHLEKVITELKADTGGDFRLLIISSDIDETLEIGLSQMRVRHGMDITWLRAPGMGDTRGDYCFDMSIFLGGTFFAETQKSLEEFELSDLGFANSTIIEYGKGSKTTFLEGAGDKDQINQRVNTIKELMETEQEIYLMEEMKKRIANLEGGAGVIMVGGNNEAEIKEKIYRIDDTIRAVECAMEEGYVVGGGVTLYQTQRKLQERADEYVSRGLDRYVVEFALDSLLKPMFHIIDNAGASFENVKEKLDNLKSEKKGFNSNTMKIEDLLKSGVIDPAKVTKACIRNAFSTANLVLTSQTVVKPTEIISK